MKKKLKIFVSLVLVFFLGLCIFWVSNRKEEGPVFTEADIDASDSVHYSIHDEISFRNISFRILNFTLNEESLIIETDLTEEELQEIHDFYTFSIGSEDSLFKLSSQTNQEKNLDIKFDNSYSKDEIEQIMIIENESREILITVNLYN